MSIDERDMPMHFLIGRLEEVMADFNILKDAQLRMNAQVEKLTKVVFGLTQQINEVMSKLEQDEKPENEDIFLSSKSFPKNK